VQAPRPASSPAQRLAQRAWRLLHIDAGQAYRLIERAARQAQAQQDDAGLAWAELVRGFHQLYFATPEQAGQQLASARARFAALGQRNGAILAGAGHARALWRQGRVQQALEELLPLRDEGLANLRNEQRGVLLNAIAGCYSAQGNSENAFAYRKALRADCTCNGRDPAGLAPVDLTLDSSLRSGDVIATTSGLVAYTGVKLGASQTAEFTPVASYPGLTADVRARLGEMKVAPVSAEMVAANAPLPETARDAVLPATSVPKTVSTRDKRAEVN